MGKLRRRGRRGRKVGRSGGKGKHKSESLA